MKKLSPVLIVEAIEPCLGFWTKLGFAVVVEVPDGDRLGFVLLTSGSVEVMYQTRQSIAKDLPALSGIPVGATTLYLEVDDLDTVEPQLDGAPVVHARRKTFYGATEIAVREPAGNAVIFSQH